MKIKCETIGSFLDTIQGLVERGLTFDACAERLIITLTGGY